MLSKRQKRRRRLRRRCRAEKQRQYKQQQQQQQQQQRRLAVLSAMLPILGAHNLGGFSFNLGTLLLLNRGLKFVATPPKLDSPTLQASVSRFVRTVRLRCEFGGGTIPKFRVPSPGYNPPPAPQPVESFLRKLSTAVHSRFHTIVHSRPKAVPNLSFAEREALRYLKGEGW